MWAIFRPKRPYNGHITDFLSEQVAGSVALLIQAKKGPLPWACQLRLRPLRAEARADGLAPSNIRENTTKLACFGLFLATKSHYVGYVMGMGIMLRYVNNGIDLGQAQ